MFQIVSCQINTKNLKGWYDQGSKGHDSIDRQIFEEYLLEEVQVMAISEKKL
tara:strand:- start:374 stop:529 length:156 start_codon:yes stop_codon:yes gene_type:complete